VGFTRPLPKAQAARYVQELVYRDRVVAVLTDRHALAWLREISLEKLANENWVLLGPSAAPELVDGFRLLCTNAGFSPRVINEPARIQAVLMMVAAGIGVSLAPSSVRSFYQPGVTLVPIQPDPPLLDLVAARPDGEPPPTVAAFFDTLRQQLPRIRSKYAYNPST
jgi:DNA-binding transcriptional LysR family regulator